MKHYLLAILLLAAACQSATDNKIATSQVAVATTTPQQTTEAEKPSLSLATYDQLKIGMPQEEVEKVMG
jgi:uncharacterized protein YcfL